MWTTYQKVDYFYLDVTYSENYHKIFLGYLLFMQKITDLYLHSIGLYIFNILGIY